ncbi:MAG: DUF1257 domain-containing protein [Pyrinomonadaceae bacterium]
MSKYLTFTDVVFTNKALLLAALADLGYSDVEQGEGLHLYGYRGDVRAERAEIVVRRRSIGSSSNDLGFARSGEGYTPIISEYDQRTLHDGKFVASLRAAYNERVVKEMQQRLRGSLRRETQGSVVKLKIRY